MKSKRKPKAGDSTVFFENHMSNVQKQAVARALGPALLREGEVAAQLAHFGAEERIAAAKKACAERRQRRSVAGSATAGGQP